MLPSASRVEHFVIFPLAFPATPAVRRPPPETLASSETPATLAARHDAFGVESASGAQGGTGHD